MKQNLTLIISCLLPSITWKHFETEFDKRKNCDMIEEKVQISRLTSRSFPSWISPLRDTVCTVGGGNEFPICRALHHHLWALLPYAKTLISKLSIRKATLLSDVLKHPACANVIWIPTQISKRDPGGQSQSNAQVLGKTHVHLSPFKFSLLERITVILPLTDSHGNLQHCRHSK